MARTADDRGSTYSPDEELEGLAGYSGARSSRDAGSAGAGSQPGSIAGASPFMRGAGSQLDSQSGILRFLGGGGFSQASNPAPWRWDQNTGYGIGQFLSEAWDKNLSKLVNLFIGGTQGGPIGAGLAMAGMAAADRAGRGGPGGGPQGKTFVDTSLYSPNDPVADFNATFDGQGGGGSKPPGANLPGPNLGSLPQEGFNFGRSPGYGQGIYSGMGGAGGGDPTWDFLKYR